MMFALCMTITKVMEFGESFPVSCGVGFGQFGFSVVNFVGCEN
jgi:hypothetical protein